MPNVENLKALRAVLVAVPDDRLHMRVVQEETTCGTACCALGWALHDPALLNKLNHAYRRRGHLGTIRRSASFDGMVGAAQGVFGLMSEDATRLFAGGISSGRRDDPHAVTKAEVLDNLDRLIAGEAALPYLAIVEEQHAYEAGRFSRYTGPCAGGRVYPPA